MHIGQECKCNFPFHRFSILTSFATYLLVLTYEDLAMFTNNESNFVLLWKETSCRCCFLPVKPSTWKMSTHPVTLNTVGVCYTSDHHTIFFCYTSNLLVCTYVQQEIYIYKKHYRPVWIWRSFHFLIIKHMTVTKQKKMHTVRFAWPVTHWNFICIIHHIRATNKIRQWKFWAAF